MREDRKANTSLGAREAGFTLQLSCWFLMKQNPSSQELFASDTLTPLSAMKTMTLSFLSYRNMKYDWANYAVPSCHFLSVIGNARCPEMKSASCSEGTAGREEDKGSQSGGDLIRMWGGAGACGEEVINEIRVFKKFCLKPLSSPVVFSKPHSPVILVLWQGKLTLLIR